MITALKTSTGKNFTKLKIDTDQEYQEFLKEHEDLFRFITYSSSKQEDGSWIIVY